MNNRFYTFVGLLDNKIYQRYYNSENIEVVEEIDEYDYDLFIETNKPNCIDKALNNKTLRKMTFNTSKELKDFYKENKDLMTIHGNDSPVHQFIAKEYNYDVTQHCEVKVLNFDIEVEHAQGLTTYGKFHRIKLENQQFITLLELKLSSNMDIKVWDEEKLEYCVFKDSCYAQKNIGFPDVEKADAAIMSISMKQFGNHKFYSFGTKDCLEYDNPNGEYIKCKNEAELLAKFMSKWREINPQYVTGWNCQTFDISFLLNRVEKVLGKKYKSYLSPFYNKVKNNDRLIREKRINDILEYEIFGLTVFDYLELYKNFNNTKQESYKLDYIGEIEVNQNKVSFAEYGNSLMRLYEGDIIVDMKTEYTQLDTIMQYAVIREHTQSRLKEVGYDIQKSGINIIGNEVYKIDLSVFKPNDIEYLDNDELCGLYNYCDEQVKALSYKKFVMYNEQDANIVELIDNKMLFIKLAIRVAHMSKSQMKEIYGSVAPWDNMIYSRLLDKNRQIPPRKTQDKTSKFEGAFVKEPTLGHHRFVATVDLKSLYPSIIRMCNMSPETIIKYKDEDVKKTLESLLIGEYDTSAMKAKGHVTSANGSVYSQDFEGVLPETMRYLMDERDLIKNKMKDVKRQLEKAKEERNNRNGNK